MNQLNALSNRVEYYGDNWPIAARSLEVFPFLSLFFLPFLLSPLNDIFPVIH
jgi:hypothetical protein